MNNFHQNIRRLYREEARPGMEFGFALACCLILVCLLLLCVFCCQNRANKKKDRGLNFDEENQTKGRNAILDDADTDSEGSQGSLEKGARNLPSQGGSLSQSCLSVAKGNYGLYDVLIDKNTMPFEPAGNTFLRGLLCKKAAEYENASSNAGKAEIASKLWGAIGTNGGRVLTNVESKKDKKGVDPEGVWSDASERATMDFLLKELEGSGDEIVTQLNANDVFVDKTCNPYEPEGNMRMLRIMKAKAVDYAGASSKSEKKDIAFDIMDEVNGNGGRFLTKADASASKIAGAAWRMADDKETLDYIEGKFGGSASSLIPGNSRTRAPHDVLIDADFSPSEPEGNTRLRVFVNEKKPSYFATSSTSQKTGIAVAILSQIHGNGGRFLTRVEGKKDKQAKSPMSVWSAAHDNAALGFILSQLEGTSIDVVGQLSPMDVLLEESHSPFEADGNSRLRGVVQVRKAEFRSGSKSRKKDIVVEIMEAIISNGGRFLCKADASLARRSGINENTDAWMIADRTLAIDFISGLFTAGEGEIVRHLNSHDVHIDPSSALSEGDGNARVRGMVGAKKTEYLAATTKDEKEIIAIDIRDHVNSNGGRFLKKAERPSLDQVTEEWKVATEKSAMAWIHAELDGRVEGTTYQINSQDVLLDRTTLSMEPKGNTSLRGLLKTVKPRYLAASSQSEKMKIATGIVKQVQINGGRFMYKAGVSKGLDSWRAVSDDAAVQFVMKKLEGSKEEGISQTNVNDVFLDNSSDPSEPEGNTRLRALALAQKNTYGSTLFQSKNKTKVAVGIMADIHAKGGRFLTMSGTEKTKDTDARIDAKTWRTADETITIEFIKQQIDGAGDGVVTQPSSRDILPSESSAQAAIAGSGTAMLVGLLKARTGELEAVSSDEEKASIASEIIEEVQGNGGRFLKVADPSAARRAGVANGVAAWQVVDHNSSKRSMVDKLDGSVEVSTKPNGFDVFVDGSSSSPSEAEGNARLKGMVSSRQAKYAATSSIGKKIDIAFGVVDGVKAKGGRFLKKAESSQIKTAGLPKDTDAWRVVGDNIAVDFVTAMFEGKHSKSLCLSTNTMITTCDVHKCFSGSCKACQAKTGETSFVSVGHFANRKFGGVLPTKWWETGKKFDEEKYKDEIDAHGVLAGNIV